MSASWQHAMVWLWRDPEASTSPAVMSCLGGKRKLRCWRETAGLEFAPAGAWRGDLLMIAAACCMALYNVWSRPFINRVGALPFTTMAMGVGAACLIVLALVRRGLSFVAHLSSQQWGAVAYLGAVGGLPRFFFGPSHWARRPQRGSLFP